MGMRTTKRSPSMAPWSIVSCDGTNCDESFALNEDDISVVSAAARSAWWVNNGDGWYCNSCDCARTKSF